MTTTAAPALMPREEALFKLIALEPILRVEMELATGWPSDETRAVLARLRQAGMVTYINRQQRQWWFCAGRARTAREIA